VIAESSFATHATFCATHHENFIESRQRRRKHSLSFQTTPPHGFIIVAQKWPELRDSCAVAAVTVCEIFMYHSHLESLVVLWQPWAGANRAGMKVALSELCRNESEPNYI
jgi:hypothetical protein